MTRWVLIILSLAGPASGPAAAQDAAAGEKTFVVCRACHQIGQNAQIAFGPVLNGVVGRKAGSYPGYDYSDANKTSGITWDEPTLQKYLASPQAVVKGTRMTFIGIKDPAKVRDVIAFLKQFQADGSTVQVEADTSTLR